MGDLCQPSCSSTMLPQLHHPFAEVPVHHTAKGNQVTGSKGRQVLPSSSVHLPQFPCWRSPFQAVGLVELFNPLSLQTKHRGSFSRLCERARPPETQLEFGGQETWAAWEPDMEQGDPGRTLSIKQEGQKGCAPGAGWQVKSCNFVSRTQPPSCVRVKRKSRT